ncbi:unnamed protein product, partial [Arabidopsis halleri]
LQCELFSRFWKRILIPTSKDDFFLSDLIESTNYF